MPKVFIFLYLMHNLEFLVFIHFRINILGKLTDISRDHGGAPVAKYIWCVCVCVFVCMYLVCVCVCVRVHSVMFDSLSPPGTIAHQAPLHGFPRQEYCSGSSFSTPEGFPTQGSNSRLLCPLDWQENSLPLAQPGKPVCLVHEVNREALFKL